MSVKAKSKVSNFECSIAPYWFKVGKFWSIEYPKGSIVSCGNDGWYEITLFKFRVRIYYFRLRY